ncbi:hypothetical protein [Elongatibacter sediminis]|uniref:Uncharacterized protein n=1 Tax=Elongatibacter sediminis TaxID=3119006 RepID=A0AAW9RER2_9GAMM
MNGLSQRQIVAVLRWTIFASMPVQAISPPDTSGQRAYVKTDIRRDDDALRLKW